MSTDTIEVAIGGEDREIFMSFGLLNELSIAVGDPSRIGAIMIDPELRSSIMMICLAERKKSGKVVKEVEDVDDIDISIDDAEKLLGWVMEAVTSFFIRALEKAAKLSGEYQTQAEALLSKVSGSKS